MTQPTCVSNKIQGLLLGSFLCFPTNLLFSFPYQTHTVREPHCRGRGSLFHCDQPQGTLCISPPSWPFESSHSQVVVRSGCQGLATPKSLLTSSALHRRKGTRRLSLSSQTASLHIPWKREILEPSLDQISERREKTRTNDWCEFWAHAEEPQCGPLKRVSIHLNKEFLPENQCDP